MTDQQIATAEPSTLPVPGTLKNLIECLIFAADEPLTVRQIKAIYDQQAGSGTDRHIDQPEIQSLIAELNEEYKSSGRPYRIIAIAGGYQFATLKEYAEWLGRLYREQSRRKLSQSSLETLAMVAYKQPISKPEIEAIRGVNCDYVLKTLLEKELVSIVGRADTVGRPLLYGTTREFLKHFGLNEITDLPRPREIEEILGESQFETERRMLEAQAGMDQMKKEEEDFKSRLPHIPKKKPELDEKVQIIPKGRSRNLTLKKKDEADESTALPSSDREHGGKPEQDSDQRVVESIVPENVDQGEKIQYPVQERSDEPIADAKEEIQPEMLTAGISRDEQRLPGDELPAEPEYSEPVSAEPLDIEDNSANTAVEFPTKQQEPSKEPEVTQPRRSAWTSWKAKIQTFIRKLFG